MVKEAQSAGSVLIVGGSRGLSGAPILAGLAAFVNAIHKVARSYMELGIFP